MPLATMLQVVAWLAQAPVDCDSNGIDDAIEVAGELDFAHPLHFEVGQVPHEIVIADLDGDRDLEIVSTDRASDTISILENDGLARFRRSTVLPVDDEPRGIDAGDIDLDGDLDLVSGNGNEDNAVDPTNSVLLSLGGGRWARTDLAASDVRAGALRSTTLADMNGDGRLDIVNGFSDSSAGGVLGILLARQDGTWSPVKVVSAREPSFDALGSAQYLAVGPVDDDAAPDIVSFAGQWLRNRGDGSLEPPVGFHAPRDPKAVRRLDVDGDGRFEIAITQTGSDSGEHGALTLFRWDGRSLSVTGEPVTLPATVQTGLASGDFDGDGALDLAAAINEAQALLFLQTSPGTLIEGPRRWDLEGSIPRWIASGDLNGDGRPDLAFPKQSGVVTVLLNAFGRDADGNGALDRCETPFARGDANGDGKLDLADAVMVAAHLFQGGPAPRCAEASDVDDSGAVDLTDALRIVRFLFQGDSPPPAPGPPSGICRIGEGEPPFLGCVAYPPCGAARAGR